MNHLRETDFVHKAKASFWELHTLQMLMSEVFVCSLTAQFRWRLSHHMVTNLVLPPRAKDLLWIALVNIPLNCITTLNTDLRGGLTVWTLPGIKHTLSALVMRSNI